MKAIAITSGVGLITIGGLIMAGLSHSSAAGRKCATCPETQTKVKRLCDAGMPTGREARATKLTSDQLDGLGRYLVKRFASSETVPSSKEIADATGLQIADRDVLNYGLAALMRLPEGRKLLDGASCSRFQACSFSRILDKKREADVDLYVRERAEDGRTYDGLRLPQFEGRDLAGKPVRSSDLAGKPAVVVLLALHCNHSVESLPILSRLAERAKPEGRRVIGVLVNSGDVEDAKYWIPFHYPDYHGQYEVWVARDASVGDGVGSHLTPTYLFVDKQGRVREKLVGFKTESEAAAGLETTALD